MKKKTKKMSVAKKVAATMAPMVANRWPKAKKKAKAAKKK